MARLSTLSRDISPPPRRKSSNEQDFHGGAEQAQEYDAGDIRIVGLPASHAAPTLAAIEAGEAQIRDHLAYFAKHLGAAIRPSSKPAITIDEFEELYKRNQHRHGRHFVVHQHDHPISGVHYDLRLQFSESSTVSFAIPYGLPGNPNSIRPNRLAIETRVHTLWNNLIETASYSTGSLLMWDTGEYDILPWKDDKTYNTDDESSDGESNNSFAALSQSERLFMSFKRRRIRLRLQGTRLPPKYTLSMWLPSSNDHNDQPRQPKRKRRRREPPSTTKPETYTSSDNEDENEEESKTWKCKDSEERSAAAASDDDEDATIRARNAYPGAVNTIGSIHQRNWVLTLDKRNSGFRKGRDTSDQGRWIGAWEPFFVCGRDHERSIITDRNADELMNDEGVEKFVGRKMWRPILE